MARCGVLDVKSPMIVKGNFKPSFPLRLMHKDLGLMLDLANRLGVALPATAATRGNVQLRGRGSLQRKPLDYSGVMRFWKR